MTCAAVGCAPRWSWSATAPWAGGLRCARSSRPPASNDAGCPRWATCSAPCPAACTPRPTGPQRDPGRRGPQPRRAGDGGGRRRVRRQVAQGRRQGHRRRRQPADLLRLSGRALAAPSDHQPNREHLRPVRARTKVTKGPGNAAAGLAMVFKLLEAAEQRWRKVNGPRLVALVRAGPYSRVASSSSGLRGGEQRGKRWSGRRVILLAQSTRFDDISRTLIDSLRCLEEHLCFFIYEATPVLCVPIGPQVARVVKSSASAAIGKRLVAPRCSPRFPLCSLYQLVQT